jgi:hypothetical protein
MGCALVPEAFGQVDTTDAVAVTTNVGAARPQEAIDGFLRDIAARYKAYVFDLCLLWGIYRTEPEWGALLAHIAGVLGPGAGAVVRLWRPRASYAPVGGTGMRALWDRVANFRIHAKERTKL